MASLGYAQGEEEKLLDGGHPILVKTPPAERDLSVKLLKYFGSQSKSGGGECDATKVDGQTYCVIFEDEDDQKRVLGRGYHIIEFTLYVTVHDIGRKDLTRIRQLPSDGERRKMLQQLDVSVENVVSFPSALYEYIMEIYKTEISKMERRYKVKIEHQSKGEGSTYVRFIPQGSESSPEKAKELFMDKVQKVMGDWSQQKVDSSVVSLTFSNIKQRVRDNWSNILVIQDGDKDVLLRGPKDELSQAMKILEKGDYKPPRPRRVVTISSDISTEILVDARHLNILKTLKHKELSDIEQTYNVKMEERVKNDNVLITLRAISAPPDLSPHASHSFITLLQKTFFNIERKIVTVKPELQEEHVGILQEQLRMRGIDIVMEYSGGTVVLIGHPIHIAFAENKLNVEKH